MSTEALRALPKVELHLHLELKEQQIPLEVCPISNVRTGVVPNLEKQALDVALEKKDRRPNMSTRRNSSSGRSMKGGGYTLTPDTSGT